MVGTGDRALIDAYANARVEAGIERAAAALRSIRGGVAHRPAVGEDTSVERIGCADRRARM
jgi:hypothetical protein